MKNSPEHTRVRKGLLSGGDALRESENRFRSTFENAAVGMAHVAPDGQFLRVNRRLSDILGYSQDQFEQLRFQDITHPDDLDADLELLQATARGERDTFTMEKRYFRPDMSVVWAELTVGCVRDSEGEVDYFISVVQDISEQKQISWALQESERRYRDTFDHAAVGIAHVAADGTWLRANPKVCEFLGYTAEELRKKTFMDVTHPDDVAMGVSYMNELRAGTRNSMRVDKRYIRKDGGMVWARLSTSCVRKDSGEVDYLISVLEDITDKKRMDRALSESEARLYAVQQTSPDGFVMYSAMYDADGHIVDFVCKYANPAADEMVGRNGTLVGRALYRDTPEHERTGLLAIFRRVMETGAPTQGEVHLPLGTRNIWIRYSAMKVEESLAVSFSDITVRKKVEMDLRESEARFRAVQQTTPDGFFIGRCVRDEYGQIADFRIEYINPAVERVIDLGRGKVIGALLSKRFPDNVAFGTFDQYVRVVETGRPWQGEVLFPVGGETRWLRITAAKVGDGVAVSYTDIHQARLVQAQLQERDQRLRLILNNVVAFVGLLSPEGVILEVNQWALDAAGVDYADVVGRHFWDTYWWSHSGDTQERMRNAVKVAAGGKRVRFDTTIRTAGDNRAEVDFQLAPTFDEHGHVVEIIPSAVDITERKKAEEHREMLVRELSHRVKNSLATVQTIASHTLREAADLDSFREAFVGRLMAISKCHDLLVETTRRNADLAQLVREQVLPYAQGGVLSNVTMSGPPMVLGAEASHTFGLILHELATNAAKYGALSTPQGRLVISWKGGPDPARPEAIVTWEEAGGPPVRPPTRRGFGSVLIEQSLAHSLGGEANIQYRPDGLWARFRFERRGI